jgi:predicted CXXCH cytochrome family protein
MARAAAPAETDPVLSGHPLMTFQLGPYSYSIRRVGGQSIYTVSDGANSASVPLVWAFGLGNGVIGQTYLYQQEGRLYETHVSYYDMLGGLDITTGHERKVPASIEDAQGKFLHDTVARQCFACHNTASITEDRLTPEEMIIGVTCEACHGPGAKHVALMTTGGKENTDKLIFNPASLKPREQTDFCGACHRTWWDVKLLDVRGLDNVRFHPYRLQSSRCWTAEDKRIACQACHDPHGSPSGKHVDFSQKCLACHATSTDPGEKSAGSAKPCPVGKKDCVGCHMPKYEPPAMHFTFTDHWIRVVRPGKTYPE